MEWNIGLGILEKINHKELKELEVLDNMISEITTLRNGQLNKLKKLALYGNRIIGISVLGKWNIMN